MALLVWVWAIAAGAFAFGALGALVFCMQRKPPRALDRPSPGREEDPPLHHHSTRMPSDVSDDEHRASPRVLWGGGGGHAGLGFRSRSDSAPGLLAVPLAVRPPRAHTPTTPSSPMLADQDPERGSSQGEATQAESVVIPIVVPRRNPADLLAPRASVGEGASTGLEAVLADHALRSSFHDFLRAEMAEENLAFVLRVHEFVGNPSVVGAGKLFAEFLADHAPSQVTVSDALRGELAQELLRSHEQGWVTDGFLAALRAMQADTKRLLVAGPLARFLAVRGASELSLFPKRRTSCP